MAIEIDKLIASIAEGVVRAKTMVDASTVEIINLYRENDLMHIFPIPTIVIDTVEIEIKAVITEVEEEDVSEQIEEIIDQVVPQSEGGKRKIRDKVRRDIQHIIEKKGIATPKDIELVLAKHNISPAQEMRIMSAGARKLPPQAIKPSFKVKAGVTQDELKDSDEKAIVTIKLKLLGDELELANSGEQVGQENEPVKLENKP